MKGKSGCVCQGCGKRYRVDFLVPDGLWAKIRPDMSRPPEAGLLCGQCIAQRIEGLGEFDAYEVISVLPPKERLAFPEVD